MTSRARRIVLAMYGHARSSGQWMGGLYVPDSPSYDNTRYHDLHCCYEAMDDLDPITADLPLSPIVGGNYGLPCA